MRKTDQELEALFEGLTTLLLENGATYEKYVEPLLAAKESRNQKKFSELLDDIATLADELSVSRAPDGSVAYGSSAIYFKARELQENLPKLESPTSPSHHSAAAAAAAGMFSPHSRHPASRHAAAAAATDGPDDRAATASAHVGEIAFYLAEYEKVASGRLIAPDIIAAVKAVIREPSADSVALAAMLLQESKDYVSKTAAGGRINITVVRAAERFLDAVDRYLTFSKDDQHDGPRF